MLDLLQRPARDLRISVTDRCNLRCRYCMPREVYGASHRFVPREELLSFEEIARVARVFAGLGVRKLRLTGGEPLLRRGLERLVEQLAAIPGIEDLALTTNGVLLARRARGLADAGLTRVTVSLDALDDELLRKVADAPVSVERILAGIDAAQAAGLTPVKVNMVVRRGLNDASLMEMAEHFREHPATLRLIEYMDVGTTNGWRSEQVVSAAEMLAAIAARWPLQPLPPDHEGEVASRFRYLDGAGEIGVVHSVSSPFCGSCTRARLSADGRLYTCLFASSGEDLRALLRGGAGDGELERRLREVWEKRADRYSELRSARLASAAEASGAPARPRRPEAQSEAQPTDAAQGRVEMSYIGG